MNTYFWVAKCTNSNRSGVVEAPNAVEAYKSVHEKLNNNSWHEWTIFKLERIE